MDFKKQLIKQIDFIKNSVTSYDLGDKDEVIRIATSLRVLFHQTNNSTSLIITHLGAQNIKQIILQQYNYESTKTNFNITKVFFWVIEH